MDDAAVRIFLTEYIQMVFAEKVRSMGVPETFVPDVVLDDETQGRMSEFTERAMDILKTMAHDAAADLAAGIPIKA